MYLKNTHIFTLTVLLLTLLLGSTTVDAQTTSWRVDFWNNVTFSGAAVATQFVDDIDYDWGIGSPEGRVAADRFSARFSRTFNLAAGEYRFITTADDGVRVYVNGERIIDEWRFQGPTTFEDELFLQGGITDITVEYFENVGNAEIEFGFSRMNDGSFSRRWRGEYFNNTTLTDPPALIRADRAVDFDWGGGSPAGDRIGVDTFSVRWTRNLDLQGGRYRITATADDGVRIFAGTQLLLDAWRDQPATTYFVESELPRGTVPFEINYYENGGNALIRVEIERIGGDDGTPPPTAPETVLIDNTDPNFLIFGDSNDWHSEQEGFRNSLLWTRSNTSEIPGYNYARWVPNLSANQDYRVEVYIPDRFSTTSNARYFITHANGQVTQQRVDQSVNGGRWVSLGTYQFSGTDVDGVMLLDVTFEQDTRLVAFDALRFVPTDGADNPPPNQPSDGNVNIYPQSAEPGTTVTAYASQFPRGATATLSIGVPASEPFGNFGSGVVQADGTVAISFVVPHPPEAGTQFVVLIQTPDGTKATTPMTIVR